MCSASVLYMYDLPTLNVLSTSSSLASLFIRQCIRIDDAAHPAPTGLNNPCKSNEQS